MVRDGFPKEARREGDWLLIIHDQLWPHFDLCYILTFIFFRIYEGFAILTVELEMLRLEGGHGLAGLGDRTAVFGFGLGPT